VKIYINLFGVFFKRKKCHLYRINGIENHIQIITHIHPTISLASLIKDIKLSRSLQIRKNSLFKAFNCWQEEYGAFTYSIKEKDRLIEYVKNQETHHKIVTFREEYIELLKEHDIEFDESYLL